MAELFVYGTLQFPEILRTVLGRTFPSTSATLGGWARYRVKNGSYPALCAEPGAATRGRILLDVDEGSLTALDDFEGSLYDRVVLRVERDGTDPSDAFVYVVPPSRTHHLTREPWDPDHFDVREREAFLASFHRGQAP